MTINLAQLAEEVAAALRAYSIPEAPAPGQVGEPLPPEWYTASLARMQASLVSPYWIDIRADGPLSSAPVILKRIAVVADDGDGSLVGFDPEGEFVLAVRAQDPDTTRGIDVVFCGVRGDVVGCFLSR